MVTNNSGVGAIGGQNVVYGNSLVEQAPWDQSGIPNLMIRGFDSYRSADLLQLLPHNVIPVGAASVTIVAATNDVHDGIDDADYIANINSMIIWLQTYRPGTRIIIASCPPFNMNNGYGDYRQTIKNYNDLWQGLQGVILVDISTHITQPNGWALDPYMDGPDGIHFGPFGINNDGWAFYMAQVKAAIGN